MKDRLIWMQQRLGSMSAQEVPHRIRQQIRMRRDRLNVVVPKLSTDILSKPLPKWPINPFEVLAEDIIQSILRDAGDLIDNPLRLLGVEWPPHSVENWSIDPVSKTHWPTDPFTFSIDFRHGHAGRDVKLIWEKHRLQHLQMLSFAAALGDQRASKCCLALLREWIAQDSPFNGLAYASGIECALRLMSLIFIASALPDGVLTSAEQRQIWMALNNHAFWLRRYPSLHSSANNHRIAELAALCILESLEPSLPDASPMKRVEELIQTAHWQFYPDGVGAEQSVHYQSLTMEWLLWVNCLVSQTPQAEGFHSVLSQGVEYLRSINDVNGNAPQIGDGDDCVVLRQRLAPEQNYSCSIAGAAAIAVGRCRRRPIAWHPDFRSAWLGLIPKGPVDPMTNAHFPNGGMSVFVADQAMLVFDHGPLGFPSTAGHGHADALAIWLHYQGRPLLMDWGTYRYNASQATREWSRSTAAHNTLCLNGESQSQTAGPFNWGRRANSKVISLDLDAGRIIAQHDGYSPTIHQREVSIGDASIVITDRLKGSGNVMVYVRFLLAGDCQVEPMDGGWRISRNNLPIATFYLQGSSLSPTLYHEAKDAGPGGQSPCYNHLNDALCLSWEGSVSLEAELQFYWAWERKG